MVMRDQSNFAFVVDGEMVEDGFSSRAAAMKAAKAHVDSMLVTSEAKRDYAVGDRVEVRGEGKGTIVRVRRDSANAYEVSFDKGGTKVVWDNPEGAAAVGYRKVTKSESASGDREGMLFGAAKVVGGEKAVPFSALKVGAKFHFPKSTTTYTKTSELGKYAAEDGRKFKTGMHTAVIPESIDEAAFKPGDRVRIHLPKVETPDERDTHGKTGVVTGYVTLDRKKQLRVTLDGGGPESNLILRAGWLRPVKSNDESVDEAQGAPHWRTLVDELLELSGEVDAETEVSLEVWRGNWSLQLGPGKPQAGRKSAWAEGTIDPGMTPDDAKELAVDMLDQIKANRQYGESADDATDLKDIERRISVAQRMLRNARDDMRRATSPAQQASIRKNIKAIEADLLELRAKRDAAAPSQESVSERSAGAVVAGWRLASSSTGVTVRSPEGQTLYVVLDNHGLRATNAAGDEVSASSMPGYVTRAIERMLDSAVESLDEAMPKMAKGQIWTLSYTGALEDPDAWLFVTEVQKNGAPAGVKYDVMRKRATFESFNGFNGKFGRQDYEAFLEMVVEDHDQGALQKVTLALSKAGANTNDFIESIDEAKAVPPIDSPTYREVVKLPKYNVKVSPLSAHGSDGGKLLARRLPDWTKADHLAAAAEHEKLAAQMDKQWNVEVNAAAQSAWGRDYVASDYRISGIASDEFSSKHKDELRRLAHTATAHKEAAQVHKMAARTRGLAKESLDESFEAEVLARKLFSVLVPAERDEIERYKKLPNWEKLKKTHPENWPAAPGNASGMYQRAQKALQQAVDNHSDVLNVGLMYNLIVDGIVDGSLKSFEAFWDEHEDELTVEAWKGESVDEAAYGSGVEVTPYPVRGSKEKMWLVRKDGTLIGYVTKFNDTKTDTNPWKAFRYKNPTKGETPDNPEADFLGTTYRGKLKGAVAAVVSGQKLVQDTPESVDEARRNWSSDPTPAARKAGYVVNPTLGQAPLTERCGKCYYAERHGQNEPVACLKFRFMAAPAGHCSEWTHPTSAYKESVDEAQIGTTMSLFLKLEKTVLKKTEGMPGTAPVYAQLIQMLGRVREAIKGHETKTGDEAVRAFVPAASTAGFLANFGAPLTQLQKHPLVDHDPYKGTLSIIESVDEMAKLSAGGRTELMRASKETTSPDDESVDWRRVTRAWMDDGKILEKLDVNFKATGDASYQKARKHSYGWKVTGKIKAELLADPTKLVTALQSTRAKLEQAGWSIESFNPPQ